MKKVADGRVPTSDTGISRHAADYFGLAAKQFPDHVLDIIATLYDAGYQAYIVGGGVRDFLLGRKPKDFDVATSARPEQVAALFPRCRLIGRRFRLAHVLHPRNRREITEVATFRALLGAGRGSVVKNRRIIRDNTYGSLEEDILRRDFTINAMYYNPFSNQLVCHRNALPDIKNRRLRCIGDAWGRYHEDPVRMLRALRFTAKLDLRMDDEVSQQIAVLAPLIGDVSPSRLFDESVKFFHSGAALKAYELLEEYGLFRVLYPGAAQRISEYQDGGSRGHFLRLLLSNTDRRIAENKPVTPAFVMAALFWLTAELLQLQAEQRRLPLGWYQAISQAWLRQRQYVAAPRRLTGVAREICQLQRHFESRRKKHLLFVANHSRFRAAYDFLCLRAESGLADRRQAEWWTRFQDTDHGGRKQMMHERTVGVQRCKRKSERDDLSHMTP